MINILTHISSNKYILSLLVCSSLLIAQENSISEKEIGINNGVLKDIGNIDFDIGIIKQFPVPKFDLKAMCKEYPAHDWCQQKSKEKYNEN